MPPAFARQSCVARDNAEPELHNVPNGEAFGRFQGNHRTSPGAKACTDLDPPAHHLPARAARGLSRVCHRPLDSNQCSATRKPGRRPQARSIGLFPVCGEERGVSNISAHRIQPGGWNLLTSLTTLRGGLPQGAPHKPTACESRSLRDGRSSCGVLPQRSLAYTRYADDLTFSGSSAAHAGAKRMIETIIRGSGFRPNRDQDALHAEIAASDSHWHRCEPVRELAPRPGTHAATGDLLP